MIKEYELGGLERIEGHRFFEILRVAYPTLCFYMEGCKIQNRSAVFEVDGRAVLVETNGILPPTIKICGREEREIDNLKTNLSKKCEEYNFRLRLDEMH